MRRAEAERLERYLAQLAAALAPLPAREREEIVREARTHIAERLERREGDLDVILQDLGPAAHYAAPFLEEHEAPDPLPRPSGRRRAVRWTVRAAAAVLQAFAVLAALLALYELVSPSRIGVWVEPPAPPQGRMVHFSIGSETAPAGHEVLGWILVPIALALGAALLAAARLLRRRS